MSERLRSWRAAGGTGWSPAAWVCVATLLSSGVAGCKRGEDKNKFAPPPPPNVVVAHPVERDVTTYLTYTGVVEASERVELRARVQGFLEPYTFQPGQRVKAGDLLFVIDKREYEAEVSRARAELEAQRAALIGAENDARLARDLADQRAGPEIDAIIKAARRDVAKAEVARAEAALAEAELNLGYCEIRAPIDGRITKAQVDAGNLVGRGEPTMLATIVQTTPAYVSIDVSEADVLEVRRGQGAADREAGREPGQVSPGQWRPSELALADESDFPVSGRVDYVAPALDSQTGTLRVRTRYENEDERLLAGLFARVRFAMSSEKRVLAPDSALLSDQQGRYAMVLNAKDEVEMRRVRIGALDGSMRVVEEGLTPQDRVVVLGVLKARPGSKVSPTMQEPAATGR